MAARAYGAVKVGDRAPLFNLPSVDGGEVALADYAGKRLALFIWASW